MLKKIVNKIKCCFFS